MVRRPAAAHREAATTTVLDRKARDIGWDERGGYTNLSAPSGAGRYTNIRAQLHTLCGQAQILLILRGLTCADTSAQVGNCIRATSQSRQNQSGILR
jgi:hypothetical protein